MEPIGLCSNHLYVAIPINSVEMLIEFESYVEPSCVTYSDWNFKKIINGALTDLESFYVEKKKFRMVYKRAVMVSLNGPNGWYTQFSNISHRLFLNCKLALKRYFLSVCKTSNMINKSTNIWKEKHTTYTALSKCMTYSFNLNLKS